MSIQIFNNLFIDKIYCLYLEEFSERKEKALKHFQDMNLNVEMFQGTYYPQNGVFGCKMGHLDIIQEAKNNNYDNILILEDDVLFEDNFPININIPLDFGLFYLAYYDYENFYIRENDSDTYMKDSKYNLLRMFYTRSTISYIVNKKTFDTILNIREHNTHHNKFIDMFYAFSIQHKFKCYGLYPMPCTINSSKSCINENEVESIEIKNKIIEKSKITFNKPIDNVFNDLVKKGEYFHYNQLQFLNGFKDI